MKLQIVMNQPEISGYIHVNPTKGMSPVNLQCADNECDEIIADNVCDYIHNQDLIRTISHYVSKLRHGGRIVLGGTEINELAKYLIFKNDIADFNRMAFGLMSDECGLKLGATSIVYIIEILDALGLKITKKRLDNCKFIVEAIRD